MVNTKILKKFKAMSPEEINIAVAKRLGHGTFTDTAPGDIYIDKESVKDYYHSRDACAEFEQWLIESLLQCEYANYCTVVIGRNKSLYNNYDWLTVSPKTRCYAFLLATEEE